MTTFTPDVARKFLEDHNVDYISSTTGVIAIALLITLQIEKELLRAAGNGSVDPWLDSAIYPLLVVFVVVVGARFLELML